MKRSWALSSDAFSVLPSSFWTTSLNQKGILIWGGGGHKYESMKVTEKNIYIGLCREMWWTFQSEDVYTDALLSGRLLCAKSSRPSDAVMQTLLSLPLHRTSIQNNIAPCTGYSHRQMFSQFYPVPRGKFNDHSTTNSRPRQVLEQYQGRKANQQQAYGVTYLQCLWWKRKGRGMVL
jgi:hypothetical protein